MAPETDPTSPTLLAYRLGAVKALEKFASERTDVPQDVREALLKQLDPIDRALLAVSLSE